MRKCILHGYTLFDKKDWCVKCQTNKDYLKNHPKDKDGIHFKFIEENTIEK